MDAVQQLSNAELKEKWQEWFNTPLPAYASRVFMLGHISWQMQVKVHGGLPRKAKSQMKKLMQHLREGKELVPERTLIIKPGTKLLREYQGKKHEVITTDQGFLYQGKTYGSLSMIAREITGTRWNGKLFFGIKK